MKKFVDGVLIILGSVWLPFMVDTYLLPAGWLHETWWGTPLMITFILLAAGGFVFGMTLIYWYFEERL